MTYYKVWLGPRLDSNLIIAGKIKVTTSPNGGSGDFTFERIDTRSNLPNQVYLSPDL
jgi:hypothetical protein